MQQRTIKVLTTLLTCAMFSTPNFSHAANSISQNDITYSPYRKAGNLIFISAQAGFSRDNTHTTPALLVDEVHEAFVNLKKQVIDAGATMDDVVKITIYMKEVDFIFPEVKQNIPLFFNKPYPARSTVGGLSFGWGTGTSIMIDAVVYKNTGGQLAEPLPKNVSDRG